VRAWFRNGDGDDGGGGGSDRLLAKVCCDDTLSGFSHPFFGFSFALRS